eukprot:5452256-Pyramimonas_sp.AAC.3
MVPANSARARRANAVRKGGLTPPTSPPDVQRPTSRVAPPTSRAQGGSFTSRIACPTSRVALPTSNVQGCSSNDQSPTWAVAPCSYSDVQGVRAARALSLPITTLPTKKHWARMV